MCEHPITMKFSNKYPIEWNTLPEEHQKLWTKGHILSSPNAENDYVREMGENAIYQQIPCGYCLECKLAKAKNMATRAMCEAMCHDENCFVTLTYNEKKLPKHSDIDEHIHIKTGNLIKKDMQLFFKRLIKKYPNKGIRRLYCGEYGPKRKRPHYHALIFGHCPTDLVFYKKKNGNILYKSKELQKIWGHGFVTVGFLTAETCGYTARYTMKKAGIKPERKKRRPNPLYNPYNPKSRITKYLYDKPIKNPEFVISSRRPGLGHNYWEINQRKIKEDKGIWIYSQKVKHVILQPIPDSFKLKWKKSNDWESYYNFLFEQQKEYEEYKQRLIKATGESWEEIRRKQIEQLHQRITRLHRDEEFIIQT